MLDKFSYVYLNLTKVTGATCGSTGLAKGSVDFIEAVSCGDSICATISAIGCAA